MISRAPQTDSFTLVWEKDSALDRARLDSEHAADESKPDFGTAYVAALDTLDFTPLLREGATPTLFKFRPIVGMDLLSLLDNSAGDLVKHAVAFRMAIREIRNLPGLELVERKADQRFRDLGQMMTDACFEKFCLEAGGTLCAVNLGQLVLQRSMALSPL